MNARFASYGRHPDCQTFDDPPGLHPHIPRSYDDLLRAYPNVEIRDGKATLSYDGRKQLKSRRAGTRPVRYPLAQLHMIELAIGCTVASDVAVASWRRAVAA